MKKVTSQMVADSLGLSRATVSRALNRYASVDPETSARVIRAAEKLGYRFSPRGGCRTVGVILYKNAVIYSYLAMALSALRREALERRCRLELVSIDDIELLGEKVLSGVIDLSHDLSLNRRWGNLRNLPMVRYYGPGSHAENIYSVRTDGAGTMQLLIDYLRSFGHRKIGLLSDQSCEVEELERVAAYYPHFCRIMRSHGELEPERYAAFAENGDVLPGIRRLCGSDVTALICINEAYGPRAAQIITSLGYRIPKDFSFLAHESFEVSQYLTPPHTTCLQDYPGMARAAFDLLEMMQRGQHPAHDIELPVRLIPRASVAAVRRPVSGE